MQGSTVVTESIRAKLEELRQKVAEEDNQLADCSAVVEEPEPVYELKAKLTRKPGDDVMWIVASTQDWTHDALDDVEIIPGTIYADDAPFLPDSMALTGYFQADGGKWVHVDNGRVNIDRTLHDADWRDKLDDFSEVVEQLNAAMETPHFRHMAEKAAMQQARREQWGAFAL